MEETGEKHKPASSLWQILSHVVSHNTHISPYAGIEVVMGTDGMLTMQYVCQPRLPRWSPS